MPSPDHITPDEPLENYEVAIKFSLDPETEQWSGTKVKILLAEEPFERGASRVCYKAKVLDEDGTSEMVVVKLFLNKTQDKDIYFNETMTQMLAQEYAEEFNSYSVGASIGFNSIHVYKLVERDGQLATVEPFLSGAYFKHNDNDGYVCGNDPAPQAFSHFSWEASNHQLLICDIQGVGRSYTDPQIHTLTGDNFGVGNMGAEGIYKFFRTHRCNHLCRALELPERGRLAAQQDDRLGSHSPVRILAPANSHHANSLAADRLPLSWTLLDMWLTWTELQSSAGSPRSRTTSEEGVEGKVRHRGSLGKALFAKMKALTGSASPFGSPRESLRPAGSPRGEGEGKHSRRHSISSAVHAFASSFSSPRASDRRGSMGGSFRSDLAIA